MDGIGSIKTVDPNRILARVKSDPNTFFDPDESGTIAAGLSADRFIIGSVVSTGNRTELIANIYDLDGTEIGDAQSDFETDDGLPHAIDALVVQLIRTARRRRCLACRTGHANHQVIRSLEVFTGGRVFVETRSSRYCHRTSRKSNFA